MDRRIWLFMIVIWYMMMMRSGVCARNIHLLPSHGAYNQGENLPSPPTPFLMREEEEEISRLGSRPPRCEHKCRGCTPCSPIQVPTAHVGPQYANYEPEGWKCKCGSIFFNP